MARVHFVKKARKDNPAVKAGESYYWWQFRYGPKRYSKERPRPSQTINSEFLSGMAAVQEKFTYDFDVAGQRDADDLQTMVEDARSEIDDLTSQAQDSLDNMPENLQYGPTGEMLQSRVDEGEAYADELEQVDLDDYDGPEVPDEGDIPEEFTEWLQEKVDELGGLEYSGE